MTTITYHKLPISIRGQQETAHMVAKWQGEWEENQTCRCTFQFIKQVRNNWDLISGRLVHLLTGHDPFIAYLKRFQLKGPQTYAPEELAKIPKSISFLSAT